jgi:ADP-heptose:LPS heptosyltransferase
VLLFVSTSNDSTSVSAVDAQGESRHAGARRVLIYRLGSLGDTVVALPSLHLIARTFPGADRALLTNLPVNATAPPAAAVLGASNLIHRYFHYPVSTRSFLLLGQLVLTIRRYKPDVLIYLAAPRGEAALQRDIRFFRLCGIRTMYGLPSGELAANLPPAPGTNLYESEAHRLARTLRPLGDARLEDPASWDLQLTREELAIGEEIAAGFDGNPYIVCAPGCKAQANDWEDSNWSALLTQLSARLPHLGLLLTGAPSDYARNERLTQFWTGKVVNTAGTSDPRQAAAMFVHAAMYIGPDSGPMHIAAAIGTPCVSIFSARIQPGIWFPHGQQHNTIYHRTDCSPCGLTTCIEEKKRCILSIQPSEPLAIALRILEPAFRTRGMAQLS